MVKQTFSYEFMFDINFLMLCGDIEDDAIGNNHAQY